MQPVSLGVDPDHLGQIENALIGCRCAITRSGPEWTARFDHGFTIVLCEPWRIVCEGRIQFADTDDGQLFGLSVPVDGPALANRLLDGKKVVSASIDHVTGDLTVGFESDTRLDAFKLSGGYEGWAFHGKIADKAINAIVLGGGNDFAIFFD